LQSKMHKQSLPSYKAWSIIQKKLDCYPLSSELRSPEQTVQVVISTLSGVLSEPFSMFQINQSSSREQ
jgi:hypothetical protein